MTVLTRGTAPAGTRWVVASRLAGRLVSVLSVSDAGSAVALVTVLRRFWPDLEPKVVAGPDAVALALITAQVGGGSR